MRPPTARRLSRPRRARRTRRSSSAPPIPPTRSACAKRRCANAARRSWWRAPAISTGRARRRPFHRRTAGASAPRGAGRTHSRRARRAVHLEAETLTTTTEFDGLPAAAELARSGGIENLYNRLRAGRLLATSPKPEFSLLSPANRGTRASPHSDLRHESTRDIRRLRRLAHVTVERDNRAAISLLSRITGRAQSGEPKPETCFCGPARGCENIENSTISLQKPFGSCRIGAILPSFAG